MGDAKPQQLGLILVKGGQKKGTAPQSLS